MNYFKMDYDGTLTRTGAMSQQKYMGPPRGWVHTQIMNKLPYTAITEEEAMKKIDRIENPPKPRKKKKEVENGTNQDTTNHDVRPD